MAQAQDQQVSRKIRTIKAWRAVAIMLAVVMWGVVLVLAPERLREVGPQSLIIPIQGAMSTTILALVASWLARIRIRALLPKS